MKKTIHFLPTLTLVILTTIISISSKSQGGAAPQAKSNPWKAAGNKIMTRWAKDVSPEKVWSEYPRPAMVRKEWKNINGLWDYAIVSKDADKPDKYDGKILVPFAVESALSGVGKMVDKDKSLWYHREFSIPGRWKDKRVLLHFGAVDWESTVWVNGKKIGTHRGGYDPFYYDITEVLKGSGEQELIIRVWDPTDEDNSTQPRGKQVKKPGGIFYTAVTGIWQTVWLEPVSKAYIESLKIVPDIDNNILKVTVNAKSADDYKVYATAAGEKFKTTSSGKTGEEIKIKISPLKLWSPDSPYLYDLDVSLVNTRRQKVDVVKSYFGMRKTSLGKDDKGILRLCLNNKPLFQLGPLDQGWWPDGLYTPASDEALKYDLEITKKLGFNMLRKHVKYEPQRFYYWCDKLGLLVWQDMPSASYIRNKVAAEKLEEADKQFDTELKRMIDSLYNHTCIVMWVPFNEGWGQHDTERIVKWIKSYDPSRLVNNASGWTDRGVGDVLDVHSYPGPYKPKNQPDRAVVLGEFGGLGLPVKEHLWQEQGNWGYRSYEQQEQYAKDYINLITRLYPLVEEGLSAAVYTQTSDCEIEINGLMTYDRKVIKLDPPEDFAPLNKGYLPPIFVTKENLFIDKATVKIAAPKEKGEIRYTLNGSDPVKTSKLYTKPIEVTKDTTIKAYCYWPSGIKSTVIEKIIKKAQPIDAVSITPSNKRLKFEYYEGNWGGKLPDFSKLEPVKTGAAEKMDLSCVDDDSDYGLRFTGYIKAHQTGVYTFYTNSDDGTKLFIAGKQIVTNDGVHGMKEERGEIALKAGWHPIELIFFQGYGGQGLQVSYEGPGIEKQTIPTKALGH